MANIDNTAFVRGFVEECYKQGVPEQHATVMLKIACAKQEDFIKSAGPVSLAGKFISTLSAPFRTVGALGKDYYGKAINAPWSRLRTPGADAYDVAGDALKLGLGVTAPIAAGTAAVYGKYKDWERTTTEGKGIFGGWEGPVDKLLSFIHGDPLKKVKDGPGDLPEQFSRKYFSPSDSTSQIPFDAGWGGEGRTASPSAPGNSAMGSNYDNRAEVIQQLDKEIAAGEAIQDPAQRRKWEQEVKPQLVARRDNLKYMQQSQNIPGGFGNLDKEIRERTEYIKRMQARETIRNKKIDDLKRVANGGADVSMWDELSHYITDGDEDLEGLLAAQREEGRALAKARRDLEELYRLQAQGNYR